jgi:hypothetical protein
MILIDKSRLRKILKNNQGKNYVYGLYRSDGSLFYVGVGVRHRVFHHTSSWAFQHDKNRLKINTIKKEGDGLLYALFLVHPERDKCLELEAKLISQFGRSDIGTGLLTNLTDGGESGPRGWVMDQQGRMQKSELGKQMSSHLSAKNKEFWKSLPDDEKAVILQRLQASSNGKAARVKIGISSKERWADAEYRERVSQSMKKAQSARKEENKHNASKAWATPQQRHLTLVKRAETRAKNKAAKVANTEPCSDILQNVN